MINSYTIIFALLGGLVPAVIWLLFWLKEDEIHPEPKVVLLITFISGMLAVPIVLPFQKIVADLFGDLVMIKFFLWVVIEEVLKFLGAYVVAFKRKEMDEPIDAIIYLITAALGFAALENTLFLLNPFSQGDIVAGIITGNMRFIGATLVHIISSAVLGIFLAFSFYKKQILKIEYTICGLILAVFLHTMFNLLIIYSDSNNVFTIFAGVWFIIILLLVLFEKVKKIIPKVQ